MNVGGKKMSNETVKSSAIAAEAAINELVGINTHDMKNKQINFSYTQGISGISVAGNTANKMLKCFSDFCVAILGQANKFPELAAKIEKRDEEEAKRWENS